MLLMKILQMIQHTGLSHSEVEEEEESTRTQLAILVESVYLDENNLS